MRSVSCSVPSHQLSLLVRRRLSPPARLQASIVDPKVHALSLPSSEARAPSLPASETRAPLLAHSDVNHLRTPSPLSSPPCSSPLLVAMAGDDAEEDEIEVEDIQEEVPESEAQQEEPTVKIEHVHTHPSFATFLSTWSADRHCPSRYPRPCITRSHTRCSHRTVTDRRAEEEVGSGFR